MADWLKIKSEYINGTISYRDLAKKYEVSFSTLQARARKENWKASRDKQYDKIETKVIQHTTDVIVKHEVNRVFRLLTISDKLVEQIERSVSELDKQTLKNKKKTRIIEYKDDSAKGKPTKETIEENEENVTVLGYIDRQGLKFLTAALKDIKDIQIAAAPNGEQPDNGLTTAIRESAQEVWKDEVSNIQPETVESIDLVGKSTNSK